VVLVAGILQYVEYHGAPEAKRAECPQEGCINFWDAFYFTIVTVCQSLSLHILIILLHGAIDVVS
jgi:hypothetical protein